MQGTLNLGLYTLNLAVCFRDKPVKIKCFPLSPHLDKSPGSPLERSEGMTSSPVTTPQSSRPSLTRIILSLDGMVAKQQALGHLLQALQIVVARYAAIHSNFAVRNK